jgi:hypothetical protein
VKRRKGGVNLDGIDSEGEEEELEENEADMFAERPIKQGLDEEDLQAQEYADGLGDDDVKVTPFNMEQEMEEGCV